MASRDKALRAEGLAALCKKLAAYFKKTDAAGGTLVSLAESVDSGFEEAEKGIAEAGKTALADKVTFSDGETFQQKLDEGKLKGEKGDRGAAGKDGAAGATGPQGPAGPNTVSTSTTTDITGLLKGDGTKVARAVEGTDYLTPGGADEIYVRLGTNKMEEYIKLLSATGAVTHDGLASIGDTIFCVGVATSFVNAKGFIFLQPEAYKTASQLFGATIENPINASADMSMMGFKLRGLPEPIVGTDAATKKYVDDAIAKALGK